MIEVNSIGTVTILANCRDAAAYFNVALATESPVPLTSFSEHPLSLLTKETRKTLTALFEQGMKIERTYVFTKGILFYTSFVLR